MLTAGNGDNEVECSLVEVSGPVELVVVVGAQVENNLLRTVDAGVVEAVDISAVIVLLGLTDVSRAVVFVLLGPSDAMDENVVDDSVF